MTGSCRSRRRSSWAGLLRPRASCTRPSKCFKRDSSTSTPPNFLNSIGRSCSGRCASSSLRATPPLFNAGWSHRRLSKPRFPFRARWLLQSGAAHDVLTLLKPWQEEAALHERRRSTLEIGLLLSIAYRQLKRFQEERSQFSEV